MSPEGSSFEYQVSRCFPNPKDRLSEVYTVNVTELILNALASAQRGDSTAQSSQIRCWRGATVLSIESVACGDPGMAGLRLLGPRYRRYRTISVLQLSL